MLELNTSWDPFVDEISVPTSICHARVGSSRGGLCSTIFNNYTNALFIYIVCRLVENGEVQESYQSQSK
jgi:hypothetical protein